jgi:hypothetical protein
VFASEWGPCAPVSEGEGSAENRKKRKDKLGKGCSGCRKEKKGDPLLAFASERGCPSAPVREREGSAKKEKKKKTNHAAKGMADADSRKKTPPAHACK